MTHVSEFDSEIRPFLGIGAIRFGQSRADVLQQLGVPTRTFKKVPFATTDTDAFNAIGLIVAYDPRYLVESVDAVAPAAISFDGLSFLGRAVEDIVRAMGGRGYKHNSLTFDEVGISLYEEAGIITSVTAFPSGYFDLDNPNSPASRAKAAAAAWRRR